MQAIFHETTLRLFPSFFLLSLFSFLPYFFSSFLFFFFFPPFLPSLRLLSYPPLLSFFFLFISLAFLPTLPKKKKKKKILKWVFLFPKTCGSSHSKKKSNPPSQKIKKSLSPLFEKKSPPFVFFSFSFFFCFFNVLLS